MPEEAGPYRARGSARDELIVRYMPLAVRLAQRYRPVNETQDDLVQVAVLGLVKAIDRYDPGRGVSFSSFAVPTILGELRRHFRDKAWAVRVPRDLQELALRVMKADETVSRRFGRSPTVGELAAELGVGVEEIVEAQEAATAYSALPLDAASPEQDEEAPRRHQESMLGAEDPGFHQAEQRMMLGTLMASISEREREILRMRFDEDLTQSEIGRRLGLSQMHVSRLIRSALARLQAAAESE